MHVTGLVCVKCGTRYDEGEVLYTCPKCGIEGILDVEYDYDALAEFAKGLKENSDHSAWRYLPMLPLTGSEGLPPLHVGWTPVYDFPKLAQRHDVGAFLLKDDGLQPTASFKDRASSVGVVKARELGFDTVACASTGNAATSLAGFCASFGLRAIIFIPASAPEAKIAQLRAFGATVLLVDDAYERAYDLCQQAVAEFGWYNRNCAVNPYLVEGKRTAGLEIAEQCADRPPDVVVIAVGDGCSIAGVYKGMDEMKRLGIWDRVPRLLGVQAEGAAPLYHAARRGDGKLIPQKAKTIADSIAVGEPRNWRKALRAVKASEGAWITVTDEEILDAAKELPAATGVFAEPTAAAAYAGMIKARHEGLIDAKDRVLTMITGNGLKDVRRATTHAPPAHPIGVSLDDVHRVLDG